MAEWDIDLTAIDGLRKWYGKQPKLMQRASAMLLNRFAWGTRDEAVRQISSHMVVRNDRFVKGRLRVTQTRTGTPIAQQRSVAGSVATNRFTGWKEQEYGTRTARKRVSTLASRNGSIQNQMRGPARLKRSTSVRTFSQLPMAPRGGPTNYGGYIAMLLRDRYKGLIRIGGKFYTLPRTNKAQFVGPGRQGGNYWKQLQLVQETKKEQPKRIRWMRTARAVYFKAHPPQKTWNAVVAGLMKPPPKR